MKYWIGTEFIAGPYSIDLISIGLVAEDGREFYAESSEVDWSKASLWTLENVRPQLDGKPMRRMEIGYAVRQFTDGDEHPVFWGYFPAYDWVAFSWLFGHLDEMPFHYPQLCLDIKQWAIELGDPELPHQLGTGTTRCMTPAGPAMPGRFSRGSIPLPAGGAPSVARIPISWARSASSRSLACYVGARQLMPTVIRGVPLLLWQRERDQRVADRRAQQNAATGGDDEDDGDGGRAARDRSRGADVRRSRRWRGSVAEHLYRKIRPLRIYEGATKVQKLIIGRDLLKARN